jgi:hypothetical protein
MEANLRKAEAEAAAERSRKLVELEKEVVRRLEDNDRLREEFIAAIGKEIWTPLIQDSMEVMAREHASGVEYESGGRKRQTGPMEQMDRSSQRPEPTGGSKDSIAADSRHKKMRLFKTVVVILGITIAVTLPIMTGSVGSEIGRNIAVSAILVALSTLLLVTLSRFARLTARTRITEPLREDRYRHVQVLKDAYSLESQILADLRAGGRPSVSPYPMHPTSSDKESSTAIDPTTRPRD